MSGENRHDLTEAQRLAQDAVRSLPRPAADAGFRARLKQDFVSGALDTGEPAGDGATGGGGFRPWMAWVPVAVAAVLLLVFFGLNPLPGPRVMGVSGEGAVVVDGRSFGAADQEAYADLVKPGSRLEVTGDAQLDITYPGSLVLRVSPGSDIVLPGRTGRWIGRQVTCAMTTGEISVLTRPGFQGNHLTVKTPDGEAVISGTLANIFVNDDLTCICLYEGHLRVESPQADLGAVEPGMRWVLHRDGSDPDYLTIAPPHRDHMLGLRKDVLSGGLKQH